MGEALSFEGESMRMYLLSDNVDTLRGMRLAGVDGVVVHEQAALTAQLEAIAAAEDIAVVLLTQKLNTAFSASIEAFRQKHRTPLFVTVPDRHGQWSNQLTDYIKDAIGVKI